jgi:hypothetical protein
VWACPVWGGLWGQGLALWCAAWRCGPAGEHRRGGGEDGGYGCDERDLPAGHAACGGDADRGVPAGPRHLAVVVPIAASTVPASAATTTRVPG